LVDNTEVGSISGEIDPAIVDLVDGCSDSDPLTHNVVYVFEGHGVMPDDYGSSGAQASPAMLIWKIPKPTMSCYSSILRMSLLRWVVDS